MMIAATGAGAAVKVTVPCGGAKGGTQGLVAAIQRANTHGGGTIRLARRCTYTLRSGSFDSGEGPAGLPAIGSPITIKGRKSSIVRGKGSPQFRLLEVDDLRSASLKIIGTVLSNGNVSTATNDEGGAILLGRHGALVVRRSTLSSNSAVNGGAINTGGARVKIVDSTLRANRAVLVDGVGGAVIAFGAPVDSRLQRRDQQPILRRRRRDQRPGEWRPSCPAEDHRQHRVEQQHHRKRRRRHLRLRPREADHPSQRDRRQQAREHRPSGDGGRDLEPGPDDDQQEHDLWQRRRWAGHSERCGRRDRQRNRGHGDDQRHDNRRKSRARPLGPPAGGSRMGLP